MTDKPEHEEDDADFFCFCIAIVGLLILVFSPSWEMSLVGVLAALGAVGMWIWREKK